MQRSSENFAFAHVTISTISRHCVQYPTLIPTTLAGSSNANEREMYGFTGGWGGVRYGRRGVDRWGVLRMLRGDWTSQPALEEHVALRL